MDSTELQLYQEEQRQALIDLNKNVVLLNNAMNEYKEAYVAPKDEVRVHGQVQVNTEKAVEVTNIDQLITAVQELQVTLDETIKNNSYKPVSDINVTNIKDAIPQSVKINNLDDIKTYFTDLAKAIKDNKPVVNLAKQELTLPTAANKPISVRLSDGKSFYNALTAIAASGGVQPFLVRGDTGSHTVAVSNNNGSVVGNALGVPAHDAGSVAYPSDTQEVYTFTLNGNTVAVVTINYTDSTKASMSSWSIA